MRRTIFRAALASGCVAITLTPFAIDAVSAEKASDDRAAGQLPAITAMRSAAQRFLDSLTPALRAKATFPLKHPERTAWSNLPSTAFKREGISFQEMSTEQRVLAQKLIQSPLSSQGYLKAAGIMKLDDVLRAIQQLGRPERQSPFGHGKYWIGVFGNPKNDAAWGWQLDGHHLALNFTVIGNEVSVTPAFMGTDPAEVRSGDYAGWRILGKEDDRGRALLQSLDEKQRAKAILGADAPRDVITGPGRGDLLTEIKGLPADEMRANQRKLLMDLLHEYAHNLEHELAHAQLARIRKAGVNKLHFAWMGTEPGKPYYYRIHGPTVLIEFDNSYPPGRRQAGSINHIHTVWRDTENDYGEDLLQRHYRESPHHQRGQTQPR